MSDPVSALGGSRFDGFASIQETGPLGMITLRAKKLKGLEKAIKAVAGTKVPEMRRIARSGDKACAWMSPDEYLLILPYPEVGDALGLIAKTLGKEHHLAVDMSDARAVFRIRSKDADQILRKLCPVDLDRMAPNEIRRSRAAQVPVAFWADDDGYTLISFRSVAEYVMGLLTHSAQPGSEH
jgi:sarcosine oxidase, subunit gamma